MGRNSEEINGFQEGMGQHTFIPKEVLVLNSVAMAAGQHYFLTCDEGIFQKGREREKGKIQCEEVMLNF